MIVAFDPGWHTACVYGSNVQYSNDPNAEFTFSFDLTAKYFLLFPRRSLIQPILYAATVHGLERIIIEDFRLRADKAAAQTNSRFETVKVIERIIVACEELNLTHLIKFQQPNVRLSARGMPKDHEVFLKSDADQHRHYVAAYQHLRYYLAMQRHKQPCDPQVCKRCGYKLHGDVDECFNCNSNPRK